MTHDFQAACWVAEVEDEVILAGLADHLAQPQLYVLLQRAEAFNEQDRALGMDTYHVEVSGQGGSGYGGLDVVEVGQDSVVFVFAGEGWCRALGRVRVGLPGGVLVEDVVAGLQRVLVGKCEVRLL
ncbi:Imm10 family immunity protein [Pseudomonas sp. NPDC089401]|uniref:Imm10 family immunity protein n=1 Tax=Pseudomonas sp. NPDC089401 TaxID=3364462 RepID=UPI00381FE6AC